MYQLMDYFKQRVKAFDGSSDKTAELADDRSFSTKSRTFSKEELKMLFSILITKPLLTKQTFNLQSYTKQTPDTNQASGLCQNTNDISTLSQTNLRLSLEQDINALEENATKAVCVKHSSLLTTPSASVTETENEEPTPQLCLRVLSPEIVTRANVISEEPIPERRLSVLNPEILTTRTNVTSEEPITGRRLSVLNPEILTTKTNVTSEEPITGRRLSVLNPEILTTRTNVTSEETAIRQTWYMAPEKPVENANITSKGVEVKTEASIIAQFETKMQSVTNKQHFTKSFEDSMKKGETEFEKLCDLINCINFDYNCKQDVIDGAKKLKSQDLVTMEISRGTIEFENKFAERKSSFKESFTEFMKCFERVDFKYPCLLLIYGRLRKKVLEEIEGQEKQKNLIIILKKFIFTKEIQHIFTEEATDFENAFERVTRCYVENVKQNNNTQNPCNNQVDVQIKTECLENVGSATNDNLQQASEHVPNSAEAKNVDKSDQSSDRNTTDSMNQSSFPVHSISTRNDDSSGYCSIAQKVPTNTVSPNVRTLPTLNSQIQNNSANINRVETNLSQSSALDSPYSNGVSPNSTIEKTNSQCLPPSEFNSNTSNRAFELFDIPQLPYNQQSNMVNTAQSTKFGTINPEQINCGFSNIYQPIISKPIMQPGSRPSIELPAQSHPDPVGNQLTIRDLLNNTNAQQLHLPSNVLPQPKPVQERTKKQQVRRLSAEGRASTRRTSTLSGQLPSMQNFQGHMPGTGSNRGMVPATQTSSRYIPAAQNLQGLIPSQRFTHGQVPVARNSPEQIPDMQNIQEYIPRMGFNQGPIPTAQSSPENMMEIQKSIHGMRSLQSYVPVGMSLPGQVSSMPNFQGQIPWVGSSQGQTSAPQPHPGVMQNFQGIIHQPQHNHVARTSSGHMQTLQEHQDTHSHGQATRHFAGQMPAVNNFQGQIPNICANQKIVPAMPSPPQQVLMQVNHHQGEFPKLCDGQGLEIAAVANQRQNISTALSSSLHGLNNMVSALSTPQRLNLQMPTYQVPEPVQHITSSYGQIQPQLYHSPHNPRNFNQVGNVDQNTSQANSVSPSTSVNLNYNQCEYQATTNYSNNVHAKQIGIINSPLDQNQQTTSIVQNLGPQNNSNQQYYVSQEYFKNPQNSPSQQQRRLNRSQSQNQQQPLPQSHSNANYNNHSNPQRRHSDYGTSSKHQTYLPENIANLQSSTVVTNESNSLYKGSNQMSVADTPMTSNQPHNIQDQTNVADTPLLTNQTHQVQDQNKRVEDLIAAESFDFKSLSADEVELVIQRIESAAELPMIPYDNTDNPPATRNEPNRSSESGYPNNPALPIYNIQNYLAQIDLLKAEVKIFGEYEIANFTLSGYEMYRLMDYFKQRVKACDGSSDKTAELADDGSFSTKSRTYSKEELKMLFSILISKPLLTKQTSNLQSYMKQTPDSNQASGLCQNTNDISTLSQPVKEEEEPPELVQAIDLFKELFTRSLMSGKYLRQPLETVISYKKNGSQHAARALQEMTDTMRKVNETIVID